MFRKLCILTAAGLALGVALLTYNIASAHSRPVRFDPAPGAILTAAPTTVTGWFTTPIRRDPNWAFIHVTDDKGNSVAAATDVTLSADRMQMSVGLKPGLAAGRYQVTWRTWDDGDGEIFGDCYNFYVGQAAADAAVTAHTRLDGGGATTCQRVEVSAKDATPLPNATLTAPTTASAQDEDTGDDAATATTSSSSKSGVPVWTLALGVVGGLVVGSVGVKVLGGKS